MEFARSRNAANMKFVFLATEFQREISSPIRYVQMEFGYAIKDPEMDFGRLKNSPYVEFGFPAIHFQTKLTF